MKKILVGILVIGLLAMLPICPIQFKINTERMMAMNMTYIISARKFPFTKWKTVCYNASPVTRQDAEHWASRQKQWGSLLQYDSIQGIFLPLDALPIPQV